MYDHLHDNIKHTDLNAVDIFSLLLCFATLLRFCLRNVFLILRSEKRRKDQTIKSLKINRKIAGNVERKVACS